MSLLLVALCLHMPEASLTWLLALSPLNIPSSPFCSLLQKCPPSQQATLCLCLASAFASMWLNSPFHRCNAVALYGWGNPPISYFHLPPPPTHIPISEIATNMEIVAFSFPFLRDLSFHAPFPCIAKYFFHVFAMVRPSKNPKSSKPFL